MHPATILQQHPRTTIYLDRDSARFKSAASDGSITREEEVSEPCQNSVGLKEQIAASGSIM